MRLLELFSGTGSIGRAFSDFEVISVDIDPKAGATHTADLLDWNYKQYPPGHFDVVWGSPPCTMYSRARTTGGPRDLLGADRLVAKTLEIIEYFNQEGRLLWAFENVGSGLLPGRAVVAGLPCSFLTYCKYADADFPKYRKLTAVWHNLPWTPRPVCRNSCPCPHKIGSRHPVSAQRGPSKEGGALRASARDSFSQNILYSMPPALCAEIAEVCRQTLQNRLHDRLQCAPEPLDPWSGLDPEAVQRLVDAPLQEAHGRKDGDDGDSEGLGGH